MEVLRYIFYCFTFPISIANGYGYKIDAQWYDYVVSVFLYLVLIGILSFVAWLLKRYSKKEGERQRKEKGIKTFMNPEDEMDEKIIEANIKRNTKNIYSNENGNNRDFINKK